jgi:hypothetical protein
VILLLLLLLRARYAATATLAHTAIWRFSWKKHAVILMLLRWGMPINSNAVILYTERTFC